MSRLMRGRLLALLGIVLVALNVRTAVSSLSPIADRIAADVPLDELGLGVIGMLPPIAFALAAIAGPIVARRIGIEWAMSIACAAMVAGPVVRAVAGSFWALALGTAIALLGMGFGNVLLPPAVKKYFPDRIGTITTVYVALLAVSTTIAAILAEPVAAGAGWRVSLAMWAVLAAVALLPWLGLGARRPRRGADEEAIIPEVHLRAPVWRSGVARSLALLLMVTAFTTYALFAWLPLMLVDRAEVTAAGAGALLALLAILGLPTGLVVPALAARYPNSSWLIVVGVASFVLACLGLLVLPGTLTWVWVMLGGLAGLVFPLVLVLINLRTRSVAGSIAVSGFVQAVGYTGGALGPLAIAVAHDATGGWELPILILLGVMLVALVPAFTLRRPVLVEDQLH